MCVCVCVAEIYHVQKVVGQTSIANDAQPAADISEGKVITCTYTQHEAVSIPTLYTSLAKVQHGQL